MNIKQQLRKAQFRKEVESRFKKFLRIFKQYTCQHKECLSETISVSLGNCSDSILSELLGEDSKKEHNLKLRRVYCSNCGRELYREVISMNTSESENNPPPSK